MQSCLQENFRRKIMTLNIILFVLDKSQHMWYNNRTVLFFSRIKITGGTHEES